MAIGPGKYDDICSLVREKVGIVDEGGVILIVLGGNQGAGFSCQADLETMEALPDMLESLISQIREDLKMKSKWIQTDDSSSERN